jgi:REP element-mobilizing transposase RayT
VVPAPGRGTPPSADDKSPIAMQLPLFAGSQKAELSRREHGGDLAIRKRKQERPVSTRRPMHVTLCSHRARGDWSLLRHRRAVSEALRACVKRTGVKVYEFANVGSHVHLLLRAPRREAFQAFLRSFAGRVARAVTGAKRGKPLHGGRFWNGLAWSRVVAWGRDCANVRHYIFLNQIEATFGPGIRRAIACGPAP